MGSPATVLEDFAKMIDFIRIPLLFLTVACAKSHDSTKTIQPNADIITVLKQLNEKITHLDKRVDAIASQVTKNEKQTKTDIEELKKEISSCVKRTTTPSSPTIIPTTESTWIFYPQGTRDHKVRRHYDNYGVTFVGYGKPTHYEVETFYTHTFEDCVVICVKRRRTHGERWNGVVFSFKRGGSNNHHHRDHGHNYHKNKCLCVEDDTGSTVPTSTELHFMF